MADVSVSLAIESRAQLNVADRLAEIAAAMPDGIAVACPRRSSPNYQSRRQGKSGAAYATTTFADLDADASRIARGLAAWGVPPGTRMALLVRPGIEFVTLVFALLRAGMVIVLIDPGLGRRNLIRCLQEAEPEGFVAIGMAQAARLLLRRKFPQVRWNVTVGRRWFWGGLTLDELRKRDDGTPTRHPAKLADGCPVPTTFADDPAAIIFTSGSTGSPKGVLYTHRMFDTQVSEIQSTYGIEAGGIDLSCFPLFALFNSAMGVTTVLPEMDFARPAAADPRKVLAAANDWQVTQAFASPAVWRIVSEYCRTTETPVPTLRKVFSCGAPVSAAILRSTTKYVAPDAKMYTPYGATECLPVSTIEAGEVIDETANETQQGAGICVGRKFESIEWRVISITDDAIHMIDEVKELPIGAIGELIVRGPQVSPRYVTRTTENAGSKIAAGESVWHRMGDVGYFDEQQRFWYCGRKSQRVETSVGTLFTERVEAIFTSQPFVARTALVGIGSRGSQLPVVVYERKHLHSILSKPGGPFTPQQAYVQIPIHLKEAAAKHEMTKEINVFLSHDSMPVDVRHNAKINREQLAAWAEMQLRHQ